MDYDIAYTEYEEITEKSIYLYLSAEGLPADVDELQLSVDNIYNTPWVLTLYDFEGNGTVLTEGGDSYCETIEESVFTGEGGVWLKIDAPDGMDEIGYLRCAVSYVSCAPHGDEDPRDA